MFKLILKNLEKILAILPFNGKKTELSLIALILGHLVPEIEPALIAQFNDSIIKIFNEGVILYGVIGVLHGRLKKRLGK
jgi:hypothetical protein